MCEKAGGEQDKGLELLLLLLEPFSDMVLEQLPMRPRRRSDIMKG